MPSADELFYSSTEMVSALSKSGDYVVSEVCKSRVFLLGHANRSGIGHVKKTLVLMLPRCP